MKTSRKPIDDFLRQRTFAVFGVSRGGKKFGNIAFKQLKARGNSVYAVHPEAEEIGGERCYPDLASIPEHVEAALLVIPPAQAVQAAKQCVDYGIRHIWFQHGSESREAVQYCEEHGASAVYGECIMMFAEPVRSVHSFHRTIWKWLGKLPAADQV